MKYKKYPEPLVSFLEQLCSAGYTMSVGDIAGSPDLGSTSNVASAEVCAQNCENAPTCCSFEWSQSSQTCNLNTGCDITTSTNDGDFLFCKRGTELCV